MQKHSEKLYTKNYSAVLSWVRPVQHVPGAHYITGTHTTDMTDCIIRSIEPESIT